MAHEEAQFVCQARKRIIAHQPQYWKKKCSKPPPTTNTGVSALSVGGCPRGYLITLLVEYMMHKRICLHHPVHLYHCQHQNPEHFPGQVVPMGLHMAIQAATGTVLPAITPQELVEEVWQCPYAAGKAAMSPMHLNLQSEMEVNLISHRGFSWRMRTRSPTSQIFGSLPQ